MNKLRLAVTSLALGTIFYLGLSPILSSVKPITAAPMPPTTATTANTDQQDDLSRQIRTWIDALSVQQGYEAWTKAQWQRYPLGPGTHGWIVLLQQGEQEIGYMVVSATTDGKWSLTEYGSGASPLFSMNTLYRSLMQQELIPRSLDLSAFQANPSVHIERIYYSPLHAVWQITTEAETAGPNLYLDAATGEQLPLSANDFGHLDIHKMSAIPTADAPMQVLQTAALPSFDPFYNTYWIHGKPLEIASLQQLQEALLKDQTITFAANLYDQQVLAPFAVTGYTEWSATPEPFIRLDQEGIRMIPMTELFENGFFFP